MTLHCGVQAGAAMQLYVPELDRIVLKDTTSERPFASTATCRKAVFTTRVLGLVHELCTKQIHVTKRDLFYTDVKLFEVTRSPNYIVCIGTLDLACTSPTSEGPEDWQSREHAFCESLRVSAAK